MSTGGRSGFDTGRVSDLSICYTRRPPGGPTSHCPQGISVLYLGVKWPKREALLSPPSIAEAKNEWKYKFTIPYAFMWPELI
jgi:hypothetical protein